MRNATATAIQYHRRANGVGRRRVARRIDMLKEDRVARHSRTTRNSRAVFNTQAARSFGG